MDKTLQEFYEAFDKGQRQFEHWDFSEDDSVAGKDLTGVEFKNCFLFLDFKNTNLTYSKFVRCNIKTADFRGANLTNGFMKNCLVEATMFKGAKVENFQFEENYNFGAIVGPNDFDAFFKDADEK